MNHVPLPYIADCAIGGGGVPGGLSEAILRLHSASQLHHLFLPAHTKRVHLKLLGTHTHGWMVTALARWSHLSGVLLEVISKDGRVEDPAGAP